MVIRSTPLPRSHEISARDSVHARGHTVRGDFARILGGEELEPSLGGGLADAVGEHVSRVLLGGC
jgi:hypothetical protein